MNFDGITVASMIIKEIADSIVDKEYENYILSKRLEFSAKSVLGILQN